MKPRNTIPVVFGAILFSIGVNQVVAAGGPQKDFLKLGFMDAFKTGSVEEFVANSFSKDAKKSWEKVNNGWLLKVRGKDPVSGITRETRFLMAKIPEGFVNVTRVVIQTEHGLGVKSSSEVEEVNIPSFVMSLLCESSQSKYYESCPDFDQALAEKEGRIRKPDPNTIAISGEMLKAKVGKGAMTDGLDQYPFTVAELISYYKSRSKSVQAVPNDQIPGKFVVTIIDLSNAAKKLIFMWDGSGVTLDGIAKNGQNGVRADLKMIQEELDPVEKARTPAGK